MVIVVFLVCFACVVQCFYFSYLLSLLGQPAVLLGLVNSLALIAQVGLFSLVVLIALLALLRVFALRGRLHLHIWNASSHRKNEAQIGGAHRGDGGSPYVGFPMGEPPWGIPHGGSPMWNSPWGSPHRESRRDSIARSSLRDRLGFRRLSQCPAQLHGGRRWRGHRVGKKRAPMGHG